MQTCNRVPFRIPEDSRRNFVPSKPKRSKQRGKTLRDHRRGALSR